MCRTCSHRDADTAYSAMAERIHDGISSACAHASHTSGGCSSTPRAQAISPVAPSPTPFRCPHAVHPCPSVDSGLGLALIHHVVAPAGSTLVFCETLLHSSGDILSDNERVIIISGYRPSNRVRSSGAEYTEALSERVPEAARTIIYGNFLSPRLRRRELDWDVGSADPGDYADGWSLTSADPDSYEVGSLTRRQPTSSP